MRPQRAAFMPGATACAAIEGAGHVDVEDGLPVPGRHAPRAAGRPGRSTPPALFTRMSIRPRAPSASATRRFTASLVGHVEPRGLAALAAERARSRQARSPGRRRPRRRRPRSAKACAIARPKPCAAPVTMTVRPLKSKFMIRSLLAIRHAGTASPARSRASQPWARRPVSISWISSTSRAVSGVGTPCSAAELDDRARAAHRPRCAACARRDRARCRCASWPSGGCSATSSSSERSPRPRRHARAEGRGIEAVERLGLTPARGRHGEDLARQRDAAAGR